MYVCCYHGYVYRNVLQTNIQGWGGAIEAGLTKILIRTALTGIASQLGLSFLLWIDSNEES